MRTQTNLSRILSLVSLAGVMALGACGDDSGTKQDLEVTKDLSVATQGTNCATLLLCVEEAGSSATAINTCITAATTAAQTTFGAIEACAVAQCLVAPDGGSNADGGGAPCASSTDTSTACVACQTAAGASSACGSYVSACENS
jgi:hypothetical protein